MNYQIKADYGANQFIVLDAVFKYSIDAKHTGEFLERQADGIAGFEVEHTARPATHTFVTGIGPMTLPAYKDLLARRYR